MKKVSFNQYVLLPILLLILLIIITIQCFQVLVEPKGDIQLYVWEFIICAAEFIFFAWLINRYFLLKSEEKIDTAGYLTIQVVIGIWFIVTVMTSSLYLTVPRGSFKAQNLISFLYLLISLTLLLGCIWFYQSQSHLRALSQSASSEKSKFTEYIGVINRMRNIILNPPKDFPEEIIKADRLAKRLEMLEIILLHITPSKFRQSERPLPSQVDVFENDIIKELENLDSFIKSIKKEEIRLPISEFEKKINIIEDLFAERQKHLV